MSRALVTGGSGFLGSHIAEELSNRDHDVTILDRTPSSWLRSDQNMVVGDILNGARGAENERQDNDSGQSNHDDESEAIH